MLQNLDTSSDLKTQLPFAFRSSLKISASELTELKAKLTRMLELSDLVIQGTNQEALLAYYGLKTDNRLDAAKIKTQMDKQKQLLLEAFVKKAVLMGKLHLIEHGIGKTIIKIFLNGLIIIYIIQLKKENLEMQPLT